MRKYYSDFHTPENLSHQIAEVYEQFPRMFIVGSLGRATVFNAFRSNPNLEFEKRDQHPLYAGTTARDIDVIGAEHDIVARTLPFWVDATSYDIGGTQLTEENGEWSMSVEGYYEAPLHPAVMEPIEAKTIYEIPCLTIPPETQLALLRVRGEFRAKDSQAFSLLSDLIEVMPTSSRLSPELFTPFQRVHEINSSRAA